MKACEIIKFGPAASFGVLVRLTLSCWLVVVTDCVFGGMQTCFQHRMSAGESCRRPVEEKGVCGLQAAS